MEKINLTPHAIKINNGEILEASGMVARVSNTFSDFDENGVCSVQYGDIQGLPEPKSGVVYVVSAMVLAAGKNAGRTDLVAPATGHPNCVRENGMIISVPGFVR